VNSKLQILVRPRLLLLLLTRDIDIAILSVRLSVCPSRSGILSKLLNILSTFLHHTIAQSFKFYEYQTSSQNSDGVTPCGGAKYRWSITVLRSSTSKSLHLANDTR